MKAVNVLLSLAILVGMFVLAMEGGLRLLGKGPNSKINQPDAELGWVKRPDFSFRRRSAQGEFDVQLRTNSLGLRDDEMESPAKPAGTFRVMCLGDSFVLGYTVDREDLFVDQLERWWDAEGRNVDVINAGTEGYATDQATAWLAREGEAFAPDLVLLFTYENDLWWNAQPEYMGTLKPRYSVDGELEAEHVAIDESLLATTAIGKLLKGAPRPEFRSVSGAGSPVLVDFLPLVNAEVEGVAEAVAHTKGALAALEATCARLGAELALVTLPSHSAIDPAYAERHGQRYMGGLTLSDWSPDLGVDRFLDAASELGIQALDPRPALEAYSGAEPLYNDVDFHLTPAGNAELTRFVKSSLDELEVFPEGHRGTLVAALPAAPADSGGGSPARWPYVFGILWLVFGTMYAVTYKAEEKPLLGFVKVGLLLSVIFTVAVGGTALVRMLPPAVGGNLVLLFVLLVVGFIVYKLGRRTGTIAELLAAFVGRGHWYLMPLVVVLLTVGSLLVVAASSPLVAPFIYTLF